VAAGAVETEVAAREPVSGTDTAVRDGAVPVNASHLDN